MPLDPHCACGHPATDHGATCKGLCSYGFACQCPSFALSQECAEQARDAGTTHLVEAHLASLGLDPTARQ